MSTSSPEVEVQKDANPITQFEVFLKKLREYTNEQPLEACSPDTDRLLKNFVDSIRCLKHMKNAIASMAEGEEKDRLQFEYHEYRGALVTNRYWLLDARYIAEAERVRIKLLTDAKAFKVLHKVRFDGGWGEMYSACKAIRVSSHIRFLRLQGVDALPFRMNF